MLLWEVNAQEGLMFGAHDSGTYEASMPSIEAGTLSLAAASCPAGTCKIVLIELNSGVPPITFRERERLAAVLQKDTSPRCFAFVTTSSATLAAAAVVPMVDKRHIQRSFSNFEDAASWTNELRVRRQDQY